MRVVSDSEPSPPTVTTYSLPESSETGLANFTLCQLSTEGILNLFDSAIKLAVPLSTK